MSGEDDSSIYVERDYYGRPKNSILPPSKKTEETYSIPPPKKRVISMKPQIKPSPWANPPSPRSRGVSFVPETPKKQVYTPSNFAGVRARPSYPPGTNIPEKIVELKEGIAKAKAKAKALELARLRADLDRKVDAGKREVVKREMEGGGGSLSTQNLLPPTPDLSAIYDPSGVTGTDTSINTPSSSSNMDVETIQVGGIKSFRTPFKTPSRFGISGSSDMDTESVSRVKFRGGASPFIEPSRFGISGSSDMDTESVSGVKFRGGASPLLEAKKRNPMAAYEKAIEASSGILESITDTTPSQFTEGSGEKEFFPTQTATMTTDTFKHWAPGSFSHNTPTHPVFGRYREGGSGTYTYNMPTKDSFSGFDPTFSYLIERDDSETINMADAEQTLGLTSEEEQLRRYRAMYSDVNDPSSILLAERPSSLLDDSATIQMNSMMDTYGSTARRMNEEEERLLNRKRILYDDNDEDEFVKGQGVYEESKKFPSKPKGGGFGIDKEKFVPEVDMGGSGFEEEGASLSRFTTRKHNPPQTSTPSANMITGGGAYTGRVYKSPFPQGTSPLTWSSREKGYFFTPSVSSANPANRSSSLLKVNSRNGSDPSGLGQQGDGSGGAPRTKLTAVAAVQASSHKKASQTPNKGNISNQKRVGVGRGGKKKCKGDGKCCAKCRKAKHMKKKSSSFLRLPCKSSSVSVRRRGSLNKKK